MLDVYTFGDGQAAQNLVNILNELQDKRILRKVERYISNHYQTIKSICTIQDKMQRNKVLRVYRKHAIPTECTGLPDRVADHMHNVLTTRIRQETEK